MTSHVNTKRNCVEIEQSFFKLFNDTVSIEAV
jgi:hypothetical protein